MLPLRQNVEFCEPSEQCCSAVDGSIIPQNGKKRKVTCDVKNGSRTVASLQSENISPHSKRQRSDSYTDKEEDCLALLMADQEKKAFSKYGNHFHELSPMALNNSPTSKPGQAKKLVIKNFKGMEIKDGGDYSLTKMQINNSGCYITTLYS